MATSSLSQIILKSQKEASLAPIIVAAGSIKAKALQTCSYPSLSTVDWLVGVMVEMEGQEDI